MDQFVNTVDSDVQEVPLGRVEQLT
jgi:hypothetical protein